MVSKMTENIEKERKILIVGLENSGKTSILLSLKEDTNILSYASLKPTRGVNIETIEKEESQLIIWDMGGQEKYRIDHLSKFYKYLIGTESIIFVIDIQDFDKYTISLEYLEDILDKIKKENVSVKLSIFLHKYDPNLSYIKRFKKIDEIIDNKIIKNIDELVPPELDYRIFKTSIYTVFEKTLVK
jgi:small GTP-binding protein